MPSVTRSSTPLSNHYQESRKILPIHARSVGYEQALLAASTVEEHIDRSLVTLAKTLETCATEQNLKDVELSMFKRIDRLDDVAHERFKGLRSEIDQRFEQVDQRFEQVDQRFEQVDQRFEQVDQRFEQVNQRFDQVDQRFDQIEQRFESKLQDLQIQITNSDAIRANGRLYRLHQPLNLIKKLKRDPITKQMAWNSHSKVPKNVKRLYDLGHHAQGIFGPTWNKKTATEKQSDQSEALNTIEELAHFYEISVYTDDQSESDATEVNLYDSTVNKYMEALLDVWGMNWHDIIKLVSQHHQAPKQIAGTKRQTETGEGAGDKRTK